MSEEAKKEEGLEFKLEEKTELRFEVGSKVTLELKSGTAEIFGTELVKNKKFRFSQGASVAVFTWDGCILELVGKPEGPYIATETPMVFYLNLHGALEQMRARAEKNDGCGPVVLVTGTADVGKSTLCRILLNYAVRLNRRPVFVDLDVEVNSISLPGSVSALPVERVAEVDEGFPPTAPLVFHYGHRSPSTNMPLYKRVVTRLAEVLSLRTDRKATVSGCIIDTGGWVKEDGSEAIVHASRAFKADVVLVIDQERLYNDLVRDIPDSKVVFVPKSGGVVVRSSEARAEAGDRRVRHYFYGPKAQLFPHSFDIKFGSMKVYKIGAPSLPDSLMPLGMKPEDKRTKLVLVQNGPNLLHHVLSLSYADSLEGDVVTTNMVGFVCVTEIDMEQQMAKLLSPQPRPLPKTLFLMGDVQFMDSQ